MLEDWSNQKSWFSEIAAKLSYWIFHMRFVIFDFEIKILAPKIAKVAIDA